LSSGAVAAGTFFAAMDLGLNIIGMMGSSGGSLFLPLLSMGITKKQLIKEVESLDPNYLVDVSLLQRLWDEGRKKVGLPRKGAKPFTGAIEGKHIEIALGNMYKKYGVSKFENGKIPFSVVSALIGKGKITDTNSTVFHETIKNHEIVFEKGDVAPAIRASLGIPIVFMPKYIEGVGSLVDGGLVDSIPVWAALNRFGIENIIIADATHDVFELKQYSADIDDIIDVIRSCIYATVQDSTLERLRESERVLGLANKCVIRVNPDNVKLSMFAVDKFGPQLNNAYDFAYKFLKETIESGSNQ
jgi:predicted acylesterase/phospholipase RssA